MLEDSMRAHIIGVILLGLQSLVPVPSAQAQPWRPVAVDVLSAKGADQLEIVFEGRSETLRLSGIDVAECMAPDARRRLDGLARGRVASLELSQPERDADWNLLGSLWVDGAMLNEILIAEGYALRGADAYGTRYDADLRGAERLARSQSLGLWWRCPPNLR
jgi:endonuclease YncB( thermonuclease family)